MACAVCATPGSGRRFSSGTSQIIRTGANRTFGRCSEEHASPAFCSPWSFRRSAGRRRRTTAQNDAAQTTSNERITARRISPNPPIMGPLTELAIRGVGMRRIVLTRRKRAAFERRRHLSCSCYRASTAQIWWRVPKLATCQTAPCFGLHPTWLLTTTETQPISVSSHRVPQPRPPQWPPSDATILTSPSGFGGPLMVTPSWRCGTVGTKPLQR